MSYKRLSLKVRHYIEVEWKKGVLKKQITEFFGRDLNTLSRELKRNTQLSESTDQLQ